MRNFKESLKEVETRFWSKVDKNNGTDCFLWTACTNYLGYGTIGFLKKTQKAHRVSWMIYHQKIIPNGMSVLHKCDVRNCVNPNHLFLGTQDDNMKDASKKGRIVSPGLYGEKNPMAILTEKEVLKMRKLRKETNLAYNKLAKIFNISTMTAYRAVTRQSWTKI